MFVTKLVASVAVVIGLGLTLALISTVHALEPNVQIVELDCDSDPELVVIKNLGDAAQPLVGWQLLSDDPDDEVFDLTALSGLGPGAAVPIQSGPSAAAVFNWSTEFVFRDGDPTDYAQIVDDTGAVIDQVNCGSAVTPEPSPTPSPESSPAPSPQPSPNAAIPNGGGPPPQAGDAVSDATMVFFGGLMAAAGVVTVALSRQRLRPRLVVDAAANLAPRDAEAARRHARSGGSANLRGEPISVGLGLALVGLLATAVVLLLLWYTGG